MGMGQLRWRWCYTMLPFFIFPLFIGLVVGQLDEATGIEAPKNYSGGFVVHDQLGQSMKHYDYKENQQKPKDKKKSKNKKRPKNKKLLPKRAEKERMDKERT